MRLTFLGAGLAVAAAIVGFGLFLNRGSHVELRGGIQKVRTHAIESGSSVAVLDFRFVNPAKYPFIVRTAEVFLELKDGKTAEGMVISDMDAKRMMEGIPELGAKYNDSLMVRTKVGPRESQDRMLAARFEVSEAEMQARKGFRIRVEDVDGAVSEIVEQTTR